MLRQSGFLICVVVALLSIGLVELYSATAISSDFRQADSLFFFKKQALWTLFSIVALLIASQVPLSLWSRMRV
ncbi:MAG: FtsW/RodA/SpoVE family cell cycle protein, partial [Planctomycetota bacterium]|nr:FtsW/RodA/SpoVE family cell cycle protein [Planctomycetota bacterium]